MSSTFGTEASTIAVSVIDNMTINDTQNSENTVDKEATPIFLQTRTAQGIAGIFVWLALFLTCQQVCFQHRKINRLYDDFHINISIPF